MNVLFLSPHFPPNYYLFCIQLRRLGANVFGVADQPLHDLHPELRTALSDYYQVSDLHNYAEVHHATATFIQRHGHIERIDSLNEHWLETEARLRSDFQVPGFKTDDLPVIKRKSVMKQLFQHAGVPVARGRTIYHAEEAWSFAQETGYPLVAKPDVGVGANRTFVIGGPHDLDGFLSGPFQGYFLEEFIHGTIETFDGLADREGNPAFFTSMVYSQGVMEVVNSDSDIYYWTRRVLPPDLEQTGRAILHAFNVRERFFHFEFFRTPEGRLLALEVNMRPPGGLSLDMFNYANNIDLYRQWAELLVSGCFSASWGTPYAVCYAGRKPGRRYVHSHEAVLAHCGPRLIHHQPMAAVFHRAMGAYAYLLRSPDEHELIGLARLIQATW